MSGVWLAAPAALADGGDGLTGTEGASIGSASQPVDVADECDHAPVSVDIDWGDGEHSPGTWAATGEFCWHIRGYHTYREESPFSVVFGTQPYTTTITVTDTGGGTDVLHGQASVSDAPLTGAPIEGATTLQGVSTSLALAHFTDGDPFGATNDYSATIDWGDGSPHDTGAGCPSRPGTPCIAQSGDGWNVLGTHTYAAAGTYVATVTAFDTLFDFTTQKVNVEVTSSGAVALSAQEGMPLSNVLLAQFCNVSGNPTASIDWGDRTSATSGTVSTNGSCDQVRASHTYAEESTEPLTTRVTLSSGPAAIGSARIDDAPLTAAIDPQALSGSSLGIPAAVFAHVTDANAGAPPCGPASACDLTAQIDWGDGSSDPAILTTNLSGIVVSGPAHTYPGAGAYQLTVTVTDKGGARAVTSGVYTVAPPPPASGCAIPVPNVGDTKGVYGAPLNSATRPNWGVSADDRVLRYGNYVLCAADSPWLYEGVSPSGGLHLNGLPPLAHDAACPPNGCQGLPVAGGVFQTTGRVVVNGIELEGENGKRNSLTVDTSTGALSATFNGAGKASYDVWSSQAEPVAYPDHAVYLGRVDLTDNPWTPEGDSLAWLPPLPPAAATSLAGFTEVGSPHIRIDGLGSSATDVLSQLPGFFRTDPTRPAGPDNQPPTFTTTIASEYPGEASQPMALVGSGTRRARARTADSSGECPANDTPPPGGFQLPDLGIGPLDVGPADFGYDPGAREWRGSGCARPLGDALAVHVEFGIKDATGFDYARGDFHTEPGIPIGGPVLLTDLGIGIGLHPTSFSGHLGATIAHIVNLDAHYFMVFAHPNEKYYYDTSALFGPGVDLAYSLPYFDATAFGLSAGASLAPPLSDFVTLSGHALFEAAASDDNRPHPYVEIGGHVEIEPPPPIDFLGSADGDIVGVFGSDTCTSRNEARSCHAGDAAFLLRGNIGITVLKFGHFDGIDAVVSSYGFAICTGSTPVGHIGFGYGINGHHTVVFPPFAGNCDTQDWRPNLAAAPSPAGVPVRVPRGYSAIGLQVVGIGVSPAIEVTGPGGQRYAMPSDGRNIGNAGRIHFFTTAATHTTYVGLWPVRPGIWHIRALPGSAPIAHLYTSLPLPPPHVTATVSVGPGRTRLLHYRVRPRPGQKVLFLERGRGAAAVIGYAEGTSGTLAFSPFAGPAGRRDIEAEITINTLPDPEMRVATFRAPPPPQPGQPHLSVTRRGSRLLASWSRTPDTTAYVVSVSATNGLRTSYRTRQRRLSLPGFSTSGATVRVTPLDPAGLPGPAARAQLRPLAATERIARLRILRGHGRVTITWTAARRAIDYQVTIALSGKRVAMLATARRTLTLELRDPKAAVTVTVTPRGADGRLGPTARARIPRAGTPRVRL